jgi:hypothetical protein
MLSQITIDVYCEGLKNNSPFYRLYVDGELLAERTWSWPSYEVFIRENIEIDIDPGQHKIKLDNCGNQTSFGFKNAQVDGKVISNDLNQELSFAT